MEVSLDWRITVGFIYTFHPSSSVNQSPHYDRFTISHLVSSTLDWVCTGPLSFSLYTTISFCTVISITTTYLLFCAFTMSFCWRNTHVNSKKYNYSQWRCISFHKYFIPFIVLYIVSGLAQKQEFTFIPKSTESTPFTSQTFCWCATHETINVRQCHQNWQRV